MKIKVNNRIIHRDIVAPHNGTAIIVESVQIQVTYGPNKGTYASASYVTINTLISACQGEEGSSYNPAESTSLTIDKTNLDELIRVLLEHQAQMKELSA